MAASRKSRQAEVGNRSSQGLGKTDILQLNFAAFSAPLVVCVTGKAQKKVKLTFPLPHTHTDKERGEKTQVMMCERAGRRGIGGVLRTLKLLESVRFHYF